MARARTRVRVKFSDTDATGAVYHGHFVYYMELGRLEVLRRVRPRHGSAAGDDRMEPLNFVVAHLEIDYRSPVHFPDVLEVDSWVRNVGTTSVSFGFRLRRIGDGVVVAEGHDVIVFVDLEGNSTPLPSRMREALQTYLDDGPSEADFFPVVVGSANPVKLRAVQSAFSRVGLDPIIEAAEVDSGAPALPVGDEAIRQGALNRAQQAVALAGSTATGDRHFGVGLESGLVQMGEAVYVTGWCVIVDGDKRLGEARSAQIRLPHQVARRVQAGEDLEEIIDSLSGLQHSGTRAGAMGYLTAGTFSRGEAWEGAVALALAPFLRPELYA